MPGALYLKYNWLDPLYEIHIRLAHGIPIMQFVVIPKLMVQGVLLLNFLVSHAIELSGLKHKTLKI